MTCTPNCSRTPTEPLPGVEQPCGGAQCPPTGGGGEPGGLTTVATQNSLTVDLSGTGTTADPLRADIRVSTIPGNLLQVDENGGLYVLREEVSAYFEIAASVTEGWSANETIFAYEFTDTAKLLENFDRSIGTAPGHLAESDLQIQINGTPVAGITITGEVVAFSEQPEIAVSRGDVLTLFTTSVAAFEFFTVTLVGAAPVRYV